MKELWLKPEKEKSLLRRHPWIFSGAIGQVKGDPESGDTVDIRAFDGRFLARAAYSPSSQITARVWSWEPEQDIDEGFFHALVQHAVAARKSLGIASDAMRLVHGESDGLPGLTVDCYGDTLVMQVTSAGAERWREVFADGLLELTGCANIFERSDAEVRALEGLAPRVGAVRGNPPELVEISEGAEKILRYRVEIGRGQKTGFYLDQRVNRAAAAEIARDKTVLDCFCYSGGFSLSALAGGAKSVTAIESSAEALRLARENLRLNGLPEERVLWMEGDVFQLLRLFRDQGRRFDVIILDPPKFAPTQAHAQKAARAYKDINLLAFKLLNPGGTLLTFSCSGGIGIELFQKIVAGAALDARVAARITQRLQAAPDHPARLNFPEGEYLKGLVLQAETS